MDAAFLDGLAWEILFLFDLAIESFAVITLPGCFLSNFLLVDVFPLNGDRSILDFDFGVEVGVSISSFT